MKVMIVKELMTGDVSPVAMFLREASPLHLFSVVDAVVSHRDQFVPLVLQLFIATAVKQQNLDFSKLPGYTTEIKHRKNCETALGSVCIKENLFLAPTGALYVMMP